MSYISKIKKRNGSIVEFDEDKIFNAVQKAFIAVRGKSSEEKIHEINDIVIEDLEKIFPEGMTPSVEDVQDLVEKEIMRQGFYDVAKAYILYRYEHAKEREEKKKETLQKIEENALTVIKRNGKKKRFNIKKIKKSLEYVASGYENIIDIDALAKQCENELYENIPTSEIAKGLVLAVRSHIEQDPAYSVLSSRLLRKILYKEVIGLDTIDWEKLDGGYRQAFVANIKKAVEIERLDGAMLSFDLEKLSAMLKPERDELILYLGLQTLYDRYFIRNPLTKEILESPQAFWMRVAMGLSLEEKDKEEKAGQFYEIISTLRFVPSTPTLFHSGTRHPQLSSCYLTTVMDSLDHIFKCIGDNAQLSKWSGGIANDWSSLRAMGAHIKGTGVESQGVIPFLKIANDTTVAINRSGRRRGATCAYLECWHMDFEDFLELRKNTGDERRRTHDMNTASWIPDLFMKRVRDDGQWTLFSPDETPELHHLYGKKFDEKYIEYEAMADQGKIQLSKRMKARDLWKKMITMLFETGHPWITFKDPSNIRSPQDHVGVVHSSNLCTEITLNTSAEETAVCNLGSVNLAQHTAENGLNIELLKETVTRAMRMLDNVININYYPTQEAQTSNLRHRPVGLGVMGFQDALYTMKIPFDSEDAVEFADASMEQISYCAILGSSLLAKERGAYETYRGSKWDRGIFPIDTIELLEQERGEKIEVSRKMRLDWTVVREHVRMHGMRNSNCMAIAPTATIANIAGCVPSIEPIYKNIYVKSNMSGEFLITNKSLIEELKKIHLWNEDMLDELKRNDGQIANISRIPQNLKDIYKETFDIDSEWLVRTASSRGKWIDQSQSLNIFIRGTSGKKISDVYQLAWRTGLKTTYYLRSMGATGIEKSSITLTKKKEPEKEAQGEPIQVPVEILHPQKMETPSIVSSVIHKVKSAITPQPLAAETPHPSSSPSKEQQKLSFCKLDDPTCEACQ